MSNLGGAKMRKLISEVLQHEYSLAKSGFDRAENDPSTTKLYFDILQISKSNLK